MQRHIYKMLLIIFVIQLLIFEVSNAQTKVQVVSQKITKSLDWEPGTGIQLHAERSEIFFSTNPSNTIEIEVIFIAKNENKSVAEEDLKKMKWIIEIINKKIFLRNYIELDRNEAKPESDIKAIYHIKVPLNCAIDISNYFGLIELDNVKTKLNINSEFSKIKLVNIEGELEINSTFGDISARGLGGDIRIGTNRSDIDLSNIYGELDIHSKLAIINVNGIEKLSKIKIDAERSKINIRSEDFNKFFFRFELYKTDFLFPDAMKPDFSQNDTETIKGSFNSAKRLPQIDIKLNIGSFTLEQ